MQNVDSLRRTPVRDAETIENVAEVELSEDDWLTLLQRTDPVVSEIIKSIKKMWK